MSDKKEEMANKVFTISADYDYLEFYELGELTDCTIKTNNKEYKCHRFVLANASEYFRDNFTSEIKSEDYANRTINLTVNPMDLMERVIRFLYNGKLEFKEEELAAMLEISKFYKIKVLYDEVIKNLDQITNPKTIMALFDNCFDGASVALKNALLEFPKYLAKFFEKFDKVEFSEKVDAVTFLKMLEFRTSSNVDTIANNMLDFFQNYDFNQSDDTKEELKTLKRFVEQHKENNKLKEILKKKKPDWFNQ